MTIVTVASPWYPLAIADALAKGGPPRVVSVPYEHWLLWRRNFVPQEQSQEQALATIRAAIA